ncbi:MAG: hypothetical protein WAK01_05745 [Methylocystis sp.]
MATFKQPDAERLRTKETSAKSVMSDLDLPQIDLDTPLHEREAIEAEKARRAAATEAFRNEKAHERPPRHQA